MTFLTVLSSALLLILAIWAGFLLSKFCIGYLEEFQTPVFLSGLILIVTLTGYGLFKLGVL